MLSRIRRRAIEIIKLPNHILLYGIVLFALGILVSMGSAKRLYELREFFPLRLPDQVNQFILTYIPFIIGTFITTVAALAGLILGANWVVNGLRTVSKIRIPFTRPGDYYRPEAVSGGLKDGRLCTYEHSPSVIFFIIGKLWSNARFISEIPGHTIRQNLRFVWTAAAIAIIVYFMFKSAELIPNYLSALGLGTGFVIPSPLPFYNLLAIVCGLKLVVALSLIPLRKPVVSREMDSMIVEGKGHPSIFFAMLEEGSKIFANKGFSNKVARSSTVACKDGEKMIGTLMESFPAYVKTSCRLGAMLSLFLGATMVLFGFLQIILMQYPSFSVGYEDFFRLYTFSLLMDLLLNVCIIFFGKGFLDQARSLMAVYRFRSSIVFVEAKGDFERKIPDLKGIVEADRLFNPLTPCAFNVRYFSAEALSEAITPEGVRELVGLETSRRLAKDVGRLKFLPFQVSFTERYPSSWTSVRKDVDEDEVTAGEPITPEPEPVAAEAPSGSH